MLGPSADVVVLVVAPDLPARVARVRLEVEAGAAQAAARGNVVPAPPRKRVRKMSGMQRQ